MQNQKYWPHIPRKHTGIYLHQQNTPLNQSDKTDINKKKLQLFQKFHIGLMSSVNILFID